MVRGGGSRLSWGTPAARCDLVIDMSRVTGVVEHAAGDLVARVRAGTINVNGGVWYSADAPFGGYKQSGNGREMGLAGFEEYLETKTIATAVN